MTNILNQNIQADPVLASEVPDPVVGDFQEPDPIVTVTTTGTPEPTPQPTDAPTPTPPSGPTAAPTPLPTSNATTTTAGAGTTAVVNSGGTSDDEEGGSSAGIVVGVLFGVLAVGAAVGAGCYFLQKRKESGDHQVHPVDADEGPREGAVGGESPAQPDIAGQVRAEADRLQ